MPELRPIGGLRPISIKNLKLICHLLLVKSIPHKNTTMSSKQIILSAPSNAASQPNIPDDDVELDMAVQHWQGCWTLMEQACKRMSMIEHLDTPEYWISVKAYATIMQHMAPLVQGTVLWHAAMPDTGVDSSMPVSVSASRTGAEAFAARSMPCATIYRLVVQSDNVMGLQLSPSDHFYDYEEETILAPHFQILPTTDGEDVHIA